MVSASRVAAASAAGAGQPQVGAASKQPMQVQERPRPQGVDDNNSISGVSREGGLDVNVSPADLPLSFGEQLVLETYLRRPRRPLNKQRQEELSQPKHKANSAMSQVEEDSAGKRPQEDKMDSEQLRDLVDRLHRPKKPAKDPNAVPGESVVLRSLEAEHARRRGVDVGAIVARLHPKVPPCSICRRQRSDEDAETQSRLCASCLQQATQQQQQQERPPRTADPMRMIELSQPLRRGANISSWRVSRDMFRDLGNHDNLPMEITPRQGLRAAAGQIVGGAQQRPVSERMQRPPPAQPVLQPPASAPAAPAAPVSARRPAQGDMDTMSAQASTDPVLPPQLAQTSAAFAAPQVEPAPHTESPLQAELQQAELAKRSETSRAPPSKITGTLDNTPHGPQPDPPSPVGTRGSTSSSRGMPHSPIQLAAYRPKPVVPPSLPSMASSPDGLDSDFGGDTGASPSFLPPRASHDGGGAVLPDGDGVTSEEDFSDSEDGSFPR